MLSLSRNQQKSLSSQLLRCHWRSSTQVASYSNDFRMSNGKRVYTHNLVPASFYSSSGTLQIKPDRFESQRVLFNRQIAKPVLFDELESDDDLDFSLEEKPTGEGNIYYHFDFRHSFFTLICFGTTLPFSMLCCSRVV